MSKTTRPCEICGKLMFNVESRRHICPTCNRKLRDERKAEQAAAKQAAENPKRRIKPTEQCVREAQKLGISYGKYVQRGYDKIVWKTILQKERIRNGRS